MSAPKSSDSPAPAFKRRNVLMILAAGTCAATVGLKRMFIAPEGAMASSPVPANKVASNSAAASLETTAGENVIASAPNVPDQLTRDWFVPHLNSPFSLAPAGETSVNITLVEISPESRINNGPVIYSAFTLLFDAPRNAPAADEICRIQHPQLGEMDLFVAPVGRTPTKVQYEAAFTRKV